MRFCKDCKYQVINNNPFCVDPAQCHAPLAEDQRNPVSGAYPRCIEVRSDKRLCGHAAEWFKEVDE